VIVDSSALVAIIRKEPGYEHLLQIIVQTPAVGVGAPTLVETGMVLVGRLGPIGRIGLEDFVRDSDISIVPFGSGHWRVAMDAFIRYGKGRHPAALNFGDCMAYAVAKLAAEPLLCKGNDFAQTDLTLAV